MSIFEKWNNQIDTKSLAEEVKEVGKNDVDYPEIPHGEYIVKIDKMELKESKNTGNPMLSVWFKIVDGEFKDKFIFMNQVINQPFQIHLANNFLKRLDSGLEVECKDYEQYNNLILDIHEEINGKLEYLLKYGERRGYNTFEILEIYDV